MGIVLISFSIFIAFATVCCVVGGARSEREYKERER